jgi:predicted ATPase
VVAKTDGVPLFVEELTKMVLESGLLHEREERYELAMPLPPLAIPTTLHDSLMARLDRLAAVKAIAQLGATLGREFSYELLRSVSPWDEATLQRGLQQLVAAELLYQRGVPPQSRYIFKHALIQEAAYQSLLRSTRQRHHQRIAQVLEARFPEVCETQPELLAHHSTEAGLHEQAIAYWQQAGQRAIERSAYVEAISHLSHGLEVLKTLPDTPERTQQELHVQTTLGPALMALTGYASPEVEAVYHRARELCQQVGETPQLLRVLTRLGTFYNVRLQFQEARELGEQALRLAQRVQDPASVADAHIVLGNTSYFLGELDTARTHLEQATALCNQQRARSQGLSEVHRGVFCLSRIAHILWYLGYPDQALRRSQEALTLARELSHPFSLVGALGSAALLHQLRREGQMTYELAEAAIALSSERGFALRLAEKTMLRGWALVEQGRGAAGIVQIRQGLAAHRATGAETSRAYIGMLAEACGKVGEIEEGLRLVAEALANRRAESQREVEFYRLKGTLLLMLAGEHHAEAETCFHQALEMARRQQAKSLELRAAMSLARLWQHQGKRAEARELLAPIYGWFTEGFDTADLQEATALLGALASGD